MAEKVLKSVIKAVVLREQWHRVPKPGRTGFNYRCTGEVQNIGVSEIRDLTVIGGIYYPKKEALIQVRVTSFRTVKTAGYMHLPLLKPNETANYDVTVEIPDERSILWGRSQLKNLDRKLLNGDLCHHVFLVYDTHRMDQRTRRWFKHEEPHRVVFLNKEWNLGDTASGDRTICSFSGHLQNSGTNDLTEFDVITSIVKTKTGEVLQWRLKTDPVTGEQLPEDEHRIFSGRGHYRVSLLKGRETMKIEVSWYLPPVQVLRGSQWTLATIKKGLDSTDLTYRVGVDFHREQTGPEVYRDTFEDPTVIEEIAGTRKVEITREDWKLAVEGQARDQDYICEGEVKNTGTVPVENIYIICTIVDAKSKEVLSWDIDGTLQKTLEMEKIAYLKRNESQAFLLKLPLPRKATWLGEELSNADIVKKINDGDFKRTTDVYYKQEDVFEEGIKRLNLGNAYFRLGNTKACIKEYQEGVRLLPKEKQFQFNLALMHYKSGQFVDALEVLDELIPKNVKYQPAYYLRGLVKMKLERYGSAVQDLNKSLRAKQKNEIVHYNIACCYFQNNQEKEGYRWLDLALEDDRVKVIQRASHDPHLAEIRKKPEFMNRIKRAMERDEQQN
jgi:tetratricopeptide (TPR) repeat protein